MEDSESLFQNLSVYTAGEQICISYSLEHNGQGSIMLYHPCVHNDVLFVHQTNSLSQTLCVLASSGCYSVAVFGIRNNGLMDPSPDKTAIARIGYLITIIHT